MKQISQMSRRLVRRYLIQRCPSLDPLHPVSPGTTNQESGAVGVEDDSWLLSALSACAELNKEDQSSSATSLDDDGRGTPLVDSACGLLCYPMVWARVWEKTVGSMLVIHTQYQSVYIDQQNDQGIPMMCPVITQRVHQCGTNLIPWEN